MRKSRTQELAERNTPVWWAAAINRWHDQTGVAHIVHEGGALCGARPFSLGGSYPSAKATGCQECRRCRAILNRVSSSSNTVTGRTAG